MVKKIVIPFVVTVTLIIITFLLFGNLEGVCSGMLTNAIDRPSTYAAISFVVLASDIVLPVPSSIVMFTNGYVLGIVGGLIISLSGSLAGSVFGYYLGKLTSLGSKAKKDVNADNIVSKYGAMAILLSRGIPILAETVSLLCGYNRMPFRKYFILHTAGYLPVCTLYAVCGSLGFEHHIFLLSFCCSLLLSFCFWILGRKYLVRSPFNTYR